MSVNVKIAVQDNARPELQVIARVTPHRVLAELGPRAKKLVQQNFLKLPKNRMGGKSTHFWGRAAAATNWQEGFGFIMIGCNQIGVRQRLLGGPIRPVRKKFLTIPAVPEAYGKSADDFNLKVKMVQEPGTGKMRLALVLKRMKNLGRGENRRTGWKNTPIFWLVRAVNQVANPKVLPTDEEFGQAADKAFDNCLRRPVAAQGVIA